MTVGKYSIEHFQGLPSLEIARAKFTKLNGDGLVKELFKNFFTEQGMDRKFGLAMLHRHFDLEPGEMLVDYDGTSPAIWSVSSEGDFKPTEFFYSEGEELILGKDELCFMERFKELLHEHEATESFGLCRYPGDDFNGLCEITHGRANINLKPSDLIGPETSGQKTSSLWTLLGSLLSQFGLADVDAPVTQAALITLMECTFILCLDRDERHIESSHLFSGEDNAQTCETFCDSSFLESS
ncbi:hypothetical protein N7494_008924 [Penicillium frequentans]|uniref:Uncharacterized protein n=1 Tax=Penicillium frequentans TaxID=3151616 RepID=A0AAD6CPP9_9EURO|nr:hypothetical protein N7494_008924 [Penicillium glabrum]